MIRSIDDLKPEARDAARAALSELAALGIPASVTSTLRTELEQRALFAQGRDSLEEVNIIRRQASMYLLTEKENSVTVTKCDGIKYRSEHQSGLAIDVVPLQGTRAVWPALSDPRWKQISDVMKKHGFEWGGDWKRFPDYPHYQMAPRGN